MASKSLLRQIRIKNYKNIAAAKIDLQPLTILVGPNGAGKSNFVDALSFVADSLSYSVTSALAGRGGIAAVRRKSMGHPTQIGFSLQIDLAGGGFAEYEFEIAVGPPSGDANVARERCVVNRPMLPVSQFEIENGVFIKEVPGIRTRIEPNRLALTIVSAAEEFLPVFDFLKGIRRYDFDPGSLALSVGTYPFEDPVLNTDGNNAVAVLGRIMQNDDGGYSYNRICSLLSRIVPEISRVELKPLGEKAILEFLQKFGESHEWRFDASAMSEGTLHSLGLLLAIYQSRPPSLIAIEEPESTIHPGALEVLIDAFLDGVERAQILLTTHSPDLLDNKKLSDEQIVVVESDQGRAKITPLVKEARDLIRQRLYAPGELLRQGELHIDRMYAEKAAKQSNFFGEMEGE